jgi:hypothetical protein
MTSGGTTDGGAQAKRAFLVLDDQPIEFVGGAPVLGYLRAERRWNAKDARTIQVIDGVEFVVDKKFWEMVKRNDDRNSAKSEIHVDKEGRLLCRNKPVEVGMRVGALGSVLRWHEWIVAIGTASDPTQATIKGPLWYLLWFSEKNLKGSHRHVVTVGMPLLRIYSN